MTKTGVFILGLLIGLAAGYILATQLKADPDNIYVLENGKTDGPDIGPTEDSTIVAVSFVPKIPREGGRGETYTVDVSEERTAPLYFATDSAAPFVDEEGSLNGTVFGAELKFGLNSSDPIGVQFIKQLSMMAPVMVIEVKDVKKVRLTPKASTNPDYDVVWEVDVEPTSAGPM